MKVSALFLLLVACGSAWAAPPENDKQPVDLVAPNIGGIGQLLSATIPYVQVPHGMARLAPITTPGITDRYLADKIYGFPVGPAMLSASTGGLSSSVEDYASEYDHDFETATPYHYAVDLESWDVHVDSTATQAAGIYRFVFPATPHAHLVLSMEKGARLEVVSDHAVQGSEPLDGTVAHVYKPTGETREYFFAEFSQPLKGYKTWRGEELSSATTQSGDHIGFVSDSPTAAGQVLEVRMGISYISTEQAKRNLDEQVAARAFNTVEAETREVWEQALGSLNVAGGTEKQRSIFYTALYRSLGRMTDITEDGRYFSGYDHAVHDSQGHDFYVDDGLWDTFRSLHPLQLLVTSRVAPCLVFLRSPGSRR
jgi:predicted alpha-1,2-mannosidase